MQANKKHSAALGIIEGFFGREWSWQDRESYADFLAHHHYNFYIYAPKGDKHLRSQWQTDWPADTKQKLLALRHHYGAAGIKFGLGLSPHEIYLDNSRDQRQQLKQRIQQLNELQPDILCILFDDMRGDIPGLAQIQIDIAHEAAELSCAQELIFCPTYYSFDPVLEKVFGTMPGDYWQTFAQKLDKAINIFWTGEKVCSHSYSSHHLQEVAELLGRKPFLWDNYPVNDGAIKSKRLHLRPFPQAHSQLAPLIAGHAVNPMNQARLSEIALTSLAQAYAQQSGYDPVAVQEQNLVHLCGPALAQELLLDIPRFQDEGLTQFSDETKRQLIQQYSAHLPNPYAQEIVDWLEDIYLFDPACLTD